jgi:hypothetical protein
MHFVLLLHSWTLMGRHNNYLLNDFGNSFNLWFFCVGTLVGPWRKRHHYKARWASCKKNQHKFASNVVEECLKYFGGINKHQNLINELFSHTNDNEPLQLDMHLLYDLYTYRYTIHIWWTPNSLWINLL